jgi:predicted PurR-regulated permease PerM
MQKNTPYILFMTLVLLVTVSFFLLIIDFLLACFWAIILAVVFDPIYQRFRLYYKASDTVPLLLTMLIIIMAFVIPFITMSFMIAGEITLSFIFKIRSPCFQKCRKYLE